MAACRGLRRDATSAHTGVTFCCRRGAACHANADASPITAKRSGCDSFSSAVRPRQLGEDLGGQVAACRRSSQTSASDCRGRNRRRAGAASRVTAAQHFGAIGRAGVSWLLQIDLAFMTDACRSKGAPTAPEICGEFKKPLGLKR